MMKRKKQKGMQREFQERRDEMVERIEAIIEGIDIVPLRFRDQGRCYRQKRERRE